MYSRILTPPKTSYFLLGARGTGKSTFLKKTYPKAKFINLLDESLYQSYLANIGLFYQELSGLQAGSRVVVDEIQRLPSLLNEVHRLIEENALIFVLSGSSARKLKSSGVNLLAGRALNCYMHPFVPEEIGKDFNLNQALRYGLIPINYSAADTEATLKAYTETYLKEEIKAEALVRNLPGFARFLSVAALSHGQILSISSTARDAEVSRTTVEGFYNIIEDTLIGFKLPAYDAKLRVREKKRPKFYFIDPGLVRAIKKNFGTVTPEEKGHLLEGLIAQILRAYKDYKNLYDDLYYWSPADTKKTEIDFLLKKKDQFVAIEVKSSKTVSKADLYGLNAINELKGLQKRIIIYLGDRKRSIDGIKILPLGDFLKLLTNSKDLFSQ